MTSPDSLAEITYLTARCHLILDALAKHEPETPILSSIRDAVAEMAQKQNVRGLRTIRRDLFEMMKVLPGPARAALQTQLDVQAGDDPASRPR